MSLIHKVSNYRHLHAVFTLFWIVMIVPTLLFWTQSILWLALMSIWANVAAHWACWQAVRAEEAAKKR